MKKVLGVVVARFQIDVLTKGHKALLNHVEGNSYITIESSKETSHQFNAYVDQLEVIFENGVHDSSNFMDIVERATVK